MKKRFLRRVDIGPDEALPEDVVQVVSVVSVKVLGIENFRKLYKLSIWAVVEEDVKNG